MKELIDTIGDGVLPAFLMSLLMFGFLPGFVLRVIVRLYPKNDPRRRELIAELYIMKRFERPMWVAEQIDLTVNTTFASGTSIGPRWGSRWPGARSEHEHRREWRGAPLAQAG